MTPVTTTREVVDAYFAAWNAGDPQAAAARFSPGGLRHWRVVSRGVARSRRNASTPAPTAGAVHAPWSTEVAGMTTR